MKQYYTILQTAGPLAAIAARSEQADFHARCKFESFQQAVAHAETLLTTHQKATYCICKVEALVKLAHPPIAVEHLDGGL